MSIAEQVELLFREKRSEEVERNSVSDELWSATVDELDANKREVFVTCLWRTYLTGYSISCFKRMLLDLIL